MSGNINGIVAVVVTWNRKDLLRQCLDSILGQEGASCDVLIVDNASDDGTAKMIETEFVNPRIRYFNTGTNFGSAGGFHLGVYDAYLRGYELIWVMDDDVIPEKGALKALLRADEALEGKWGFLSSVAYWIDGTICKPNKQKKGLFTFVKEEEYGLDYVSVRFAAMASLMLKAAVVREVGLPIPEYFFYSDDYEYTGRISKEYPSYMVPSSRVTHTMARNVKPRIALASQDSFWRYAYLYRNDVHLYRQYGMTGRVYLGAKFAYTVADVLKNAGGGRLKCLSTLMRGALDGIRFYPETPAIPSFAPEGCLNERAGDRCDSGGTDV